MPERKKKRGFFDIFDFGEENFPFDDSFQSGGSGYSISVTCDKQGKPIVQAKTHEDVDAIELRKDLEWKYPGVRIEGLEEKPLIKILDKEGRSEREEAKGK
jgi:hypothetical protein